MRAPCFSIFFCFGRSDLRIDFVTQAVLKLYFFLTYYPVPFLPPQYLFSMSVRLRSLFEIDLGMERPPVLHSPIPGEMLKLRNVHPFPPSGHGYPPRRLRNPPLRSLPPRFLQPDLSFDKRLPPCRPLKNLVSSFIPPFISPFIIPLHLSHQMNFSFFSPPSKLIFIRPPPSPL